MADVSPVLLEVADGVATVTFNRPDTMNSLDVATKEALLAALRQVADDPAVRCVVLTGSGRAFCVGQDLKEHVAILRSGATDSLFRTVEEHYNPIVSTLVGMQKPVIAAVNGVAAGAGASLAFACDLRIVADTAGFNLAFANIALSCDTGSSFTLQRLVGRAKAIELLYFPTTIPAEDSLALGLASRVVPAADLDAAVLGYARAVARQPKDLLALQKLAINRTQEAQGFRQALLQGTEIDAIAHASPAVRSVNRFIGEHGLQEALAAFRRGDLP